MRYVALTTLLALSASSLGWAAAGPAGASSAAYEQVDRFNHFGRLDNWRAVDEDTLIVWATPFRAYLIELTRSSPDLRFAEAIGVTSTVGTTYAKFDSVRVRGWDYPIKAIYKLSREEARDFGSEASVAAKVSETMEGV